MSEGYPALVGLPLAVWERDGLAAALAKAGLPADDIKSDGPLFWRFESKDVPVGFGGLEVHGDQALLRSLVTLPPVRNRGIGRAIVAALETEARARGCRTVWLLAPAEGLFEKLGYRRCEREDMPPALRERAPIGRLYPSATAMMKRLD